MEYGDNRIKRITRFLYKWLWCSCAHYKHKCWPRDPSHWHCLKCHPCGEGIDIILGEVVYKWL